MSELLTRSVAPSTMSLVTVMVVQGAVQTRAPAAATADSSVAAESTL